MNRIESLFVNFQLLRRVSTMIQFFEQCHERKESSQRFAFAVPASFPYLFVCHLHTKTIFLRKQYVTIIELYKVV